MICQMLRDEFCPVYLAPMDPQRPGLGPQYKISICFFNGDSTFASQCQQFRIVDDQRLRSEVWTPIKARNELYVVEH